MYFNPEPRFFQELLHLAAGFLCPGEGDAERRQPKIHTLRPSTAPLQIPLLGHESDPSEDQPFLAPAFRVEFGTCSLGSKTYHPFRGNILQKLPEPLRVVNGRGGGEPDLVRFESLTFP